MRRREPKPEPKAWKTMNLCRPVQLSAIYTSVQLKHRYYMQATLTELSTSLKKCRAPVSDACRNSAKLYERVERMSGLVESSDTVAKTPSSVLGGSTSPVSARLLANATLAGVGRRWRRSGS